MAERTASMAWRLSWRCPPDTDGQADHRVRRTHLRPRRGRCRPSAQGALPTCGKTRDRRPSQAAFACQGARPGVLWGSGRRCDVRSGRIRPTEPTPACACRRRQCPLSAREPGGQTALMQLPAEAVTATVLIEVVRISALPTRRDVPYPGTAVAHWAGSEAAAALALIENLPRSEQPRCGFSPFCFTCHEVRIQGTAVPPALATQFSDP